MDFDLKDRTAIVTGGGRGIGRAITAALVAAGARVHLCGRQPAPLTAAAAALGPDRVTHTVCDLADPAAVDALFADARRHFAKLDLLVNNAAVGRYAPGDQVTLAEWDQVMNVNARATFFCAQAAFRWMKTTGGGRIVNIASVVGHKGYENQAAYTASKHAVMGLTKVLAREGQPHRIRVLAICPGGVATEMAKQARPDLDPAGLIQPADVARAVLYLATESASCVTDCLYLRREGSTPFA
jgi:3-oxoacyl-[acyl-carrier protein] reductase